MHIGNWMQFLRPWRSTVLPRRRKPRTLQGRSFLISPEAIERLEDRVVLTAEAEPNSTKATATPFSGPSDTLTGAIGSISDIDYFSINLASGDTLQIYPSNSGTDGRTAFAPSLELFNSAGEAKGVSLTGEVLNFTATSAGTYSLRLTASNLFGYYIDNYSINISVTAFNGTSEAENNNSLATANGLSGSQYLRGSITGSADVDYFSFPATAGQGMTLKFADDPVLNPAVRLYSPNGTLMVTSRDGLGIAATLAQSGVYRFAVQGDNMAGAITGPYLAQLALSNQPEFDAEAGDNFDSATVLDLGPYVVSGIYLSPDASFGSSGLMGTYIDVSLRGTAVQADWRETQTIAGQRLDPAVHFGMDDFGNRSQVGITHDTDANWDNFSVQWDGYIKIVTEGTQLRTSSDDGSRFWIDINGDGIFNPSGPEYVSNNWGGSQSITLGPASTPLSVGTYKIRIQYEEGVGGNRMYLLWTDKIHSAGALALFNHDAGLGVLTDLSDIDVYAVDESVLGFYAYSLRSLGGAIATQGRILTLYNEFGQPLEYSVAGQVATNRIRYRPESNSRYYVTVQAIDATGLGAYELTADIFNPEFPNRRDVPIFFQDFTAYDYQAMIPEYFAFFESRYDIYQIDMTLTKPPAGVDRVEWYLANGPGGGSASGGAGYRSVSGGGGGSAPFFAALVNVDLRLSFHENGHGVGLPHFAHPLDFMSYGAQYDYSPVGSFNVIGNDARAVYPKLLNERNYLDWVLESGRLLQEDEANDSLAEAQWLEPYFADMANDADPRNDGVVIAGALGSSSDIDVYRFNATGGQRFAIDVDAAEFQYPLNSLIELLKADGTVIAVNDGAIDRDSGIVSVDPYLVFTFSTSGQYYVRVSSQAGTFGNYRLKIIPDRAFDQAGPRVAAAWPDGSTSVDGTRQLIFWTNDQLDPATLTSSNIMVTGLATGLRPGNAIFDPLSSTLIWRSNSPLPADTYTVTLKSGVGGITDLRGNPLDGETDGAFAFPDVSGNGVSGGNFTTTFTITQPDNSPAAVTSASYSLHPHNRGLFDIFFSDELDIIDVYSRQFTLRGAGPDHVLGSSDDTFSPVDIMYDPRVSLASHVLRVYSRGTLDPDTYRVEGTVLDAVGNTVTINQTFEVAAAVPASALFTSPAKTTGGLLGSYVDERLSYYTAQDDWRVSLTISGTRTDPVVDFTSNSFGLRSEVGITGGTDANWDDFSVQWDGVITIPANGVRLFTRSDDSSRMWIDVNHDGTFASSGAEFVNNHWGSGQPATLGPASVPLAGGTYQIRIQYEEGSINNQIQLMWDYSGTVYSVDGIKPNLKVVDLNVPANTSTSAPPASIDVTLSGSVTTDTLTPSNFKVRYSPDSAFFNGNDSYLTDADGVISWNPSLKTASFGPATPLVNGYYLIELNGSSGGITSAAGRLLDGEYRDANIAGFSALWGWNEAPSGDGIPGGDYRAMFVVATPELELSVSPGTFSETLGSNASVATLTRRNVDTSLGATVTLASSDLTEATVPATVTIPAGQTSVIFPVTAVDDLDVDGTQSVILIAQAAGYQSATTPVLVTDDEVPELFLSFNGTSMSENNGQLIATIRRTGSFAAGLTVSLQSDDTTEATVPISVVIPATQETATFFVSAVDDALLDGDQLVTVIASANGFLPTSSTLTVTDNETVHIFIVTNNHDSGSGSLRQAILDANFIGGRDRIEFSMPSGEKTIRPLSSLPFVTEPVEIDAATQPGYSGLPMIELDGSLAGANQNGLVITAGDCVVRGLIINRFSGDGIRLSQGGGNVIKGNFVGTNAAGTLAAGNGVRGIGIYDSANNLIGGGTSSQGNIISGNGGEGIYATGTTSSGNRVQGNFVGTDLSGSVAVANQTDGIRLAGGAHDNTIGTNGDGVSDQGERNLVSGNSLSGISLAGSGTENNTVAGNLLGTDATGLTAVANRFGGIVINGGSSLNTIGGFTVTAHNVISGNETAGIMIASTSSVNNRIFGNLVGTAADGVTALGNRPGSQSGSGISIVNSASNYIGGVVFGAGNIIAYNAGPGIEILGANAVSNLISSNSLYANGGLGVDLSGNGSTPNDATDTDVGPNLLQNFPTIASVVASGGSVTITGALNSTPNSTYRLEFFANSVTAVGSLGEGRQFIGAATVTTASNGASQFQIPLPFNPSANATMTATATDMLQNTSEFSDAIQVKFEPSSITLSPLIVDENRPIGTPIGSFNATDPDATGSPTYSLVAGVGATDNSRFVIVGALLKTAEILDYEQHDHSSIRVRVTDTDGLWFEAQFNITVLNVNESPAGLTLSNMSLPETAPTGSQIGALSATDPDIGDTLRSPNKTLP